MQTVKNSHFALAFIISMLMNINIVSASEEDEYKDDKRSEKSVIRKNDDDNKQEKFTICHFTAENSTNYQKINISQNALVAHAGHNDYVADGQDCPSAGASASALSNFTSITSLLDKLNISAQAKFAGASGISSWRQINMPPAVEDPIKKAKAAAKAAEKLALL